MCANRQSPRRALLKVRACLSKNRPPCRKGRVRTLRRCSARFQASVLALLLSCLFTRQMLPSRNSELLTTPTVPRSV